MIVLNGIYFASDENEFSILKRKKNISVRGYYKRYKHRLDIMNQDRKLIGVINRHGVIAKASKIISSGGQYTHWFNHGNIIEIDGANYSHSKMRADVSVISKRGWATLDGGNLEFT